MAEQTRRDRDWGGRDISYFEKRLLDERKRAVAQMAQFDEQLGTSAQDADGELTVWRFHMADEGTDTYDREQNFLLASREGQLLWHIDQALRRLYKSPETFGVCDECGQPIGFERLDAIPYTTRCVNCKQDWETGTVADTPTGVNTRAADGPDAAPPG